MKFSSDKKTVDSYLKDINKGVISMDHKVQRKNNQWNRQQKSLLIYNMILEFMPIPAIHIYEEGTVKDKTKKMWVIDGKQRLTTIDSFVKEEWKLDKNTSPIRFENQNVELSNKKYSDLPEGIQDIIKGTNILLVKYGKEEGDTDADINYDIAKIFSALNNGTPLTTDQKLRAELRLDVLDAIDNVLASPFFEKVANMTTGQLLKGQDLTVVLQAGMLVSGFDFKNFSGKEVIRYANDCNSDTIEELADCCNVLNDILGEKVKCLKKINLPMLIASVQVTNFDTAEYGNKIKEFIDFYEENIDYKQYCMTATSKKENVMGRWEYIKNLVTK